MTKGKAWAVKEELRLKELFEAGVPVSSIAARLSKTEVAVAVKARRLGLKDDARRRGVVSSSSGGGLELPDELPTVEGVARILSGALLAMTKSGVSGADVERWKAVADVAWKCKGAVAELVHYKELEREIVELRRKYEELANKNTK